LALELSRQFGLDLIFSDADGVGFRLEGKLNFDFVFFCAENNADGRLVVRGALLFVEEIEINSATACRRKSGEE